MKTCVIFTIVLALYSFVVIGQPDVYRFPITHDSSEWKDLISYSQKRAACQIPNTTLKSISTAGLLETCLDYPLLTDLLIFNDTQTGMDKLSVNFNGISELFSRPDVAQVLIRKYQLISAFRIDNNQTPIQIGKQVFLIVALESFLAQEKVINSLAKEQKKDLLRAVYQSYLQKKLDIQYHGPLGLTSASWVLCRIMALDSYQPAMKVINENSIISIFLARGTPLSYDQVNNIVIDAANYLKQ